MNNIKIGDVVYAVEPWTDLIYKEKVIDVSVDKQTVFYRIRGIGYVYSNNFCGISSFLTKYRIFTTIDEASNFLKSQHNTLVENYKKQMPDIKAVVNFALSHCIANAEEYTDWKEEMYGCSGKHIY